MTCLPNRHVDAQRYIKDEQREKRYENLWNNKNTTTVTRIAKVVCLSSHR